MGIATWERHIGYNAEGLCHASRDAALRRFHASRRGRAGCLFRLGTILVFLGKWSRRGHRGCLSRLGIILVFLGKWNRRGEAKRFLCPATAMAHPSQRRRWGRGSLSSGIGNACDFLSQSAAVKAPQLCPRKRSAVHVPMQCGAFVIAARCDSRCSALRFSFHRGAARRAAHSVPVPRLLHHSWVCTAMNWAPGFDGARDGGNISGNRIEKYRKKRFFGQKSGQDGWIYHRILINLQ